MWPEIQKSDVRSEQVALFTLRNRHTWNFIVRVARFFRFFSLHFPSVASSAIMIWYANVFFFPFVFPVPFEWCRMFCSTICTAAFSVSLQLFSYRRCQYASMCRRVVLIFRIYTCMWCFSHSASSLIYEIRFPMNSRIFWFLPHPTLFSSWEQSYRMPHNIATCPSIVYVDTISNSHCA